MARVGRVGRVGSVVSEIVKTANTVCPVLPLPPVLLVTCQGPVGLESVTAGLQCRYLAADAGPHEGS